MSYPLPVLELKLEFAREDLKEAQANLWRQRELALEIKIAKLEKEIEEQKKVKGATSETN